MTLIKACKLNDMLNDSVKIDGPSPEDWLSHQSSPWVMGQLGQSLDGRIATPTGHSHYINGPATRAFLHQLRAHVDAVVIGVGTALADQPQLSVRHVEGQDPARVVIDPRMRINPDNPVLRDDGVPVLVCVQEDQTTSHLPDHVTPIFLPLSEHGFAPQDVIEALNQKGFERLLIEGGQHTVSSFLQAGALNELFLMIAPLIIGSGPTGIQLPDIDTLDEAMRPKMECCRVGDELLVALRFYKET